MFPVFLRPSGLSAAIFAGLLAFPAWALPAHYLVIREVKDGSLSLVSSQQVELDRLPTPTTAPAQASRLESRLAFQVRDKTSGQLRWQDVASTARWERGEFQDAAGRLQTHVQEAGERFYVLRLPMQAGGQLELDASANAFASAPRLTLDLDALPANGPPNRLASHSDETVVNRGDPNNRVDLLFVGDGYTAAQQERFIEDVHRVSEQFLSLSPYREYRNMVNVRYLFMPSAESGASKPACAETPSEPVVSVNTAFNSRFCASGLRRLVSINAGAVLTAASAVPQWDHIILLVNDPEYGGSGGAIAVATLHELAVPLIQHEYGHSFTQLADEYDSAFPGFPACSDLAGSRPCEPNVTDETRPGNIKWRRWIATDTPLPSVAALADPLGAGLWLGARFLATGMYRQCHNGIMRTLGGSNPYFCHVDAEAYVLRLYAGGWSSLHGGIRNFEPKSPKPAVGPVSAGVATCQKFQVQLAGPEGSEALIATWGVNGQTVKTGRSAHGAIEQLELEIPASGSTSVTLQITDNTPLALDKPVSRAEWTVSATSGNRPDAERLLDWAQARFPSLFSPAATTQSIAGYQARFYGATNTYLGIKDCQVFVLGDAFGGFKALGPVSSFIGLVAADNF